jgi:hypothetical protein
MLAIVCVFITLNIAHAIPARPLFVPHVQPAPVATPTLAGTTWVGTLYAENERVAFFAGGRLTYGQGDSSSPGTWSLQGNNLYFQINEYSEYKTIVNGDVIQGIGWNKAGQQCKPVLRRMESKAP